MPLNSAVAEPFNLRPAVPRNDTTWLSVIGDFPSLLGDSPVSWFESAKATDCRSETRCWCDRPARLTSLDEPAIADDGPISIVLQDISRHGIGFSHSDPLPYRLVQIAFDADDPAAPILVVRLQWCRFRRPGLCESGGKIQRVVSAGPLTALPRESGQTGRTETRESTREKSGRH